MSKATLQTRASGDSVDRFLAAVTDAGRRADCRAVLDMILEQPIADPVAWMRRTHG